MESVELYLRGNWGNLDSLCMAEGYLLSIKPGRQIFSPEAHKKGKQHFIFGFDIFIIKRHF